MFIDRNQVQENGDVSYMLFTAEASELGLAPGVWPTRVQTNLGNRQDLVATRRLEDGGVEYKQLLGCITVRIYND